MLKYCLTVDFPKTYSNFLKYVSHSALKLEKSALSKVQKSIICIFKNGKKTIFAPKKRCNLGKFHDFPSKTKKNYFFEQFFLFLAHSQCSKIGKKCNFKSSKRHYLHFQKWQKNQFLHQKKV